MSASSNSSDLSPFATPRQREYLEAIQQYGSARKAAAALQVNTRTLERSVASVLAKARAAADVPNDNAPGFEVRAISTSYDADGELSARHVKEGPVAPFDVGGIGEGSERDGGAGYLVKGVSTYFDGAGNQRGQWVKTRKIEHDYWTGIEKAIRDVSPICPTILPTPPEPQSDIIPWLMIGDAHIGMLASEMETGANFDISIAKREICAAAAALIDEAPPCDRMVINDLGDGTHYETFKGETMGHHHALDYDTRYWKMIEAYVEINQYIVEKALSKAQVVDVIYTPGNHSESNDSWIAVTMRALYGKTGRVNVLPNNSPFIAYRMGKTLVLVHHGHKTKPEGCAKVMASDYSVDWGETDFRYIDGGHVHHSQRKELPGCVFESWNNLAPRDKYANDGGYRSKQLMSLVLRSRKYGERGRRLMPAELVRDNIISTGIEHYVPPQMRAFLA